MNKKIFLKRFDEAIEKVLDKARKSLIESVPSDCKFNIEYTDFKKIEPITKDEAIAIIYKDGKVPRWVNINLRTIDNEVSLINCLVAPDYFENDADLLYEDESVPPFRVGFPPLPEAYEEGKKFSVKDLKRD